MYGKYLRQDQTYVFDMLLQKLFVKASFFCNFYWKCLCWYIGRGKNEECADTIDYNTFVCFNFIDGFRKISIMVILMIHYVSGIKHSLRMMIQGKFTGGTAYISIRNSALFVDSSLRISIIFTPTLQQIKNINPGMNSLHWQTWSLCLKSPAT